MTHRTTSLAFGFARAVSPVPCFALAVALAPSHAQAQGFDPPSTIIGTLGNPSRISLHDFDGDGDLDPLLTSNSKIGTVENRGSGSTSTFQVIATPSDTSRGEVVADFDLDGDLDILFAGPGLTLSVNVGDGTFGSPVQVVSQDFGYRGLAAHDLDGDGIPDLTFLRLGVPTWMRGDGARSFGSPQSIGTATDIDSMDAADMDGDGDLDVICVKRVGSETILLTGSVGATQWSATTLSSQSSNVTDVYAGDLDGDGDQDVLAASAEQAVWWQENLGGSSFAASVLIGFYDPADQDVRLREPQDYDLDGDVDLILAFTEPFGFNTGIFLRRNDGTGVFGQEETLIPYSSSFPFAAFGDLDSDGDTDHVDFTRSRVAWRERTPAGLEEEISLSHPWTSPKDVIPYDVDHDGDVDFLTWSRTFYNSEFGFRIGWLSADSDGSGYTTRTIFESLGNILRVRLDDVDSDGLDDLVLLYTDSNADLHVGWLPGTGPGSFGALQAIPLGVNQLPYGDLLLADMEGDGDLDWAIHYRYSTGDPWELRWIETDGFGGQLLSPTIETLDSTANTVRAVDLDGDGAAEIVMSGSSASGSIFYRPNLGTGRLGPPVGILGSTSLERQVELGDIDGDGDADLLVRSLQRVTWIQNAGQGQWPLQSDLVVGQATSIDLDDVNGDGQLDVLVGGFSGGAPRIFINLGAGASWGLRELDARFSAVVRMEVEDVDQDGGLDVLALVFNSSGSERLYHYKNQARFGLAYCGPGVPSSSGSVGSISASGSDSTAVNQLTLLAASLPPATFGYFLVSPESGFVAQPGGSQGNLCLSGAVGRLNRSQQEIFFTDLSGQASVSVDLSALPSPTASFAAQPGDTYFFQGWFRDANPAVGSNFTRALRLPLR